VPAGAQYEFRGISLRPSIQWLREKDGYPRPPNQVGNPTLIS
jgi:hypothetical protein